MVLLAATNLSVVFRWRLNNYLNVEKWFVWYQLRYTIGLTESRHFFIQSEERPKAIVTRLHAFSRASRQLHVITWVLIGSLVCRCPVLLAKVISTLMCLCCFCSEHSVSCSSSRKSDQVSSGEAPCWCCRQLPPQNCLSGKTLQYKSIKLDDKRSGKCSVLHCR